MVIGIGGAAIGWAAAMTRTINSIGRVGRTLRLPRRGALREVRALRSLRDAEGRFRLKIPREWNVTAVGAVEARPPRVGSLVRVDIFPDETSLWASLIRALERREAKVRPRTETGPRILSMRAEVRLEMILFDWRAPLSRRRRIRGAVRWECHRSPPQSCPGSLRGSDPGHDSPPFRRARASARAGVRRRTMSREPARAARVSPGAAFEERARARSPDVGDRADRSGHA
jgi:hypothetical protein